MKALVLKKQEEKKDKITYVEDEEAEINDNDIIRDVECKSTQNKKKKTTVYEVDASLIVRAKKVADNLISNEVFPYYKV